MSHVTKDQPTLVKARKAARVAFELFLMGGAILLLIGILTAFLPQVLNGLVLIAASIIPFVVSKIIEKKIDQVTQV